MIISFLFVTCIYDRISEYSYSFHTLSLSIYGHTYTRIHIEQVYWNHSWKSPISSPSTPLLTPTISCRFSWPPTQKTGWHWHFRHWATAFHDKDPFENTHESQHVRNTRQACAGGNSKAQRATLSPDRGTRWLIPKSKSSWHWTKALMAAVCALVIQCLIIRQAR